MAKSEPRAAPTMLAKRRIAHIFLGEKRHKGLFDRRRQEEGGRDRSPRSGMATRARVGGRKTLVMQLQFRQGVDVAADGLGSVEESLPSTALGISQVLALGLGTGILVVDLSTLLLLFPAAEFLNQGFDLGDEVVAFGLVQLALRVGDAADAHDAEPVVGEQALEEALQLYFFVLGAFFFDVAELFFATL